MSLQRGKNVRGWEGVTKGLAANDEERNAWRVTLIGLLMVLIVTGVAGFLLSQTGIPTVAKVLMILGVLIGTLVLMSGVYSALVPRTSEDTAEGAAAEAEARRAAAAARAEAKARADEEAAARAKAAAKLEAERIAAEQVAAKAAAEKAQAEKAASEKAAADAAAKATAASADPGPDRDGDGVAEGKDEGTRPTGLEAARDGQPDDLKLIKGVGPKLEGLCNSLGFWHFDQIANWTSDEIAWVDSNLEGFTGRVTRDDWVAQAKILAAGGETEFSSRQ